MEDLHCKLENMKPLCVFSVIFTGSIDTDTELHCGYSGPCHSIVVCDFVHHYQICSKSLAKLATFTPPQESPLMLTVQVNRIATFNTVAPPDDDNPSERSCKVEHSSSITV